MIILAVISAKHSAFCLSWHLPFDLRGGAEGCAGEVVFEINVRRVWTTTITRVIVRTLL